MLEDVQEKDEYEEMEEQDEDKERIGLKLYERPYAGCNAKELVNQLVH